MKKKFNYDRFTQEGEAKHQAFDSVRAFEKCVADYAGSKYAVAVDSCTNALFLCCKYFKVNEVTIPADSTLEVFAGQKIVVETTDVITIGAKTASKLDATLSVMEIT